MYYLWHSADSYMTNENKIWEATKMRLLVYYPAGNYLFKVNNKSTRTRCEIC